VRLPGGESRAQAAAAPAIPAPFCGAWHTGFVSWTLLLSPPETGEVERRYLLEAFDSGWVTPAGPDLDAFEAELSALVERPVVALSSGTAALHLALSAVGVRAGDDVLVSTLTFAAPAFACAYLGARPVFVDADPVTWQMDARLVADELDRRAATGSLPAAVVAVDLYGAMADQVSLAEICARFEVPLIEDAAESLGATLRGRPGGSFGTVATLSFNGNKIATTGGGGALTADAETVATQARQPVAHYEHTDIGHNYRLSNLLAAVGRGQLATLTSRIAQRVRVSEGYRSRLASMPGVTAQGWVDGGAWNAWLNTFEFGPGFGAGRDDVLAALRVAGIEARPAFKPLHLQPIFADSPIITGAADGRSTNAERHFRFGVSLPSGGTITDDQVEWVCRIIDSVR
jgi:dTDP-4-amino-4,6-dideoxygalactose transaminase